MWPGRVSNPEPLTYESAALPIALRGPAYIQLYSQTCLWSAIVKPAYVVTSVKGSPVLSSHLFLVL